MSTFLFFDESVPTFSKTQLFEFNTVLIFIISNQFQQKIYSQN